MKRTVTRTEFFDLMRREWGMTELNAVRLFDDIEGAEIEGEHPVTIDVRGVPTTFEVGLLPDGETPVWIITQPGDDEPEPQPETPDTPAPLAHAEVTPAAAGRREEQGSTDA